MKTIDSFQKFYKQSLAASLQDLHYEKQGLLKEEANAPAKNPRIKKLKRYIFLVSIPIVLLLLFTVPLLILFYVVACYLVINIGGRMGVSKMGEFRQKYKEQIIREIIGFFGYEFEYKPFESISRDQLNQSMVFPHFAPGLIGEDYINGKIGKTSFEFSEIFALTQKEPAVVQMFASAEQKKINKLKMITEFDSLFAKSSNPFFRGLFFIADFHKDFSCTAVVRPKTFRWGIKQMMDIRNGPTSPAYNVTSRLIDEMATEGHNKTLERVHLEDPEFESVYNVYSNDQVISRYILSTAMMQRIKDFRAKTGKDVFLAFKNSGMYLAIPYERSLLEPKGVGKEHFSEYLKAGKSTKEVMNEESPDESHIDEFFTDLHFIFGIVDDFNLNTRIWTKKANLLDKEFA